jgi:putative addiction module component (TIGR02574 family)
MDASTKTVFDAALALPAAERAALAEQLLASLSPDDGMDEEELAAELERRPSELERDPSGGIAWEQLKAER